MRAGSGRVSRYDGSRKICLPLTARLLFAAARVIACESEMIELADYSISQCLHEGSETAVYSGLRRRDNLPVVVKMPRDDHPLPTVLNRLRHEYALLREYAQPGVVQGLELVRSPSSLALVLEYVEGEPDRKSVV